jgi:hypothetical protein
MAVDKINLGLSTPGQVAPGWNNRLVDVKKSLCGPPPARRAERGPEEWPGQKSSSSHETESVSVGGEVPQQGAGPCDGGGAS